MFLFLFVCVRASIWGWGGQQEKLELYLQDNPLCSDVDSTLDSKMAGAHYFSLSSISSKVIQ